MLIDTHTHLYDERFDADRSEAVQRAIEAGVTRLYLPNCDSSTIGPMLDVETRFPQHCFAMMGLHPTYVNETVEDELAMVRHWLDQRPFAAVGEIGLDYYWDTTHKDAQHHAFRTQMVWAVEKNLPIVIHNREATRDTIDLVKEFSGRGIRGVFHCFTGSYETAKEITALGFYLGIGGVLTYPKAGLGDVVKKLGPEHLVLETDAPYLSPVPHRGKRNESAYIPYVLQKLAEALEMPAEEVARQTTRNAEALFGIPASAALP
jgi:TatD DNase family protein